jgi:hypothetical protein
VSVGIHDEYYYHKKMAESAKEMPNEKGQAYGKS